MDLKTYLSTSPRGTAAKLAAHLGVSPSFLSQMASGASPINAERCVEIEKFSGGAVMCEELDPSVDWSYLRHPTPTPAGEASHA